MIKITWTVSIADLMSLIEQFIVLFDLLYLTLLARGYSQMKREQMRRDNVYNKL
jgi:hypothetical protein